MEPQGFDERDPDTVKVDLLVDQVNALLTKMDQVMERGHQSQTVIHKSEGMGAWGAAAVTACCFTFLGLILFAFIVLPDVHDLKAYQQNHEKRINKLESKP